MHLPFMCLLHCIKSINVNTFAQSRSKADDERQAIPLFSRIDKTFHALNANEDSSQQLLSKVG